MEPWLHTNGGTPRMTSKLHDRTAELLLIVAHSEAEPEQSPTCKQL
jgi:hypothetical protein